MRIWTVHPRYLDRQGLLALWRESLLAQAVLLGKTKGYRHHPQLIRFQQQSAPTASIATYLDAVLKESLQRGYHFDKSRIQPDRITHRIPETRGQLDYEWKHLKLKLKARSPEHFDKIEQIVLPTPHPLFEIVPGEVQDWEKVTEQES